MGVAISDWRLAKAVATRGYGGVVSGTGIAPVLAARLSDGDIGGHMRRALSHFPFQESVQRVLDKYFIPASPESRKPQPSYKRPPLWTLNPSKALNELTVIANFAEVFLAKEGHRHAVGINLLEKVQMPIMASLYGAMLAGVDFVIIGAGIPGQIPDILDKLVNHQAASYRLDMRGGTRGDDYQLHFDPQTVFPGVMEKLGQLTRPYFMPIISSVVLAKALIKRTANKIDGFVVEMPSAGGHNAPPRGALRLNQKGEPLYGKKDEVDLDKIKKLRLPFWLGGGYDSPEKLRQALSAGAAGIQVGTAFACCVESALDEVLKNRVIKKTLEQTIIVHTDPTISPTGYPFKVVQLEKTLSEPEVYQERPRVCDIGLLRQLYKQANGQMEFRCSAEPVARYLAKGGKLEDTVGKSCLCNNLLASAGYPQRRADGYIEPPLVTAGDGLATIVRFIKPGCHSYTVQDVLDYLTE